MFSYDSLVSSFSHSFLIETVGYAWRIPHTSMVGRLPKSTAAFAESAIFSILIIKEELYYYTYMQSRPLERR
jgi:hypothetical protein